MFVLDIIHLTIHFLGLDLTSIRIATLCMPLRVCVYV